MLFTELENYYRIFDLISNTGKSVLDTYMLTKLNGMSVEDFINNNKHKIFHLWKNRIPCCKCNGIFRNLKHQLLFEKQWHGIFIKNNNKCQNNCECICGYIAKSGLGFSAFDITSITCIMLNCVSMPTTATTHIKEMRKLRNIIDHKGQKQFTKEEFDQYRQEVKTCILNIAGECSPTIKEEFKIKIESRLLVDLSPTTTQEVLRVIQESQSDKDYYQQAVHTAIEEVKAQLQMFIRWTKNDTTPGCTRNTSYSNPEKSISWCTNSAGETNFRTNKGNRSSHINMCQLFHLKDKSVYNSSSLNEAIGDNGILNPQEHMFCDDDLPEKMMNGNHSPTNSTSQFVEFASDLGNVRQRMIDKLPYLMDNLNPDVIIETDNFHTLIEINKRQRIQRSKKRCTRVKELLEVIAETSDINIQEFLNTLLNTGQDDIYTALIRDEPTPSREQIRFVDGVPHDNCEDNDNTDVQLILQFQGDEGTRHEETLQNHLQTDYIEIDELTKRFSGLSLYDSSSGSVIIHLRSTDTSRNALESIQRSFIDGSLKKMILAILEKSGIGKEAVIHITIKIENQIGTSSQDKAFYERHFEYLMEELCPKPVAAMLYKENIINRHEVSLVFCHHHWDRRSQVNQLITIMKTKQGAVKHFMQALRDTFQSRVAAALCNESDTDIHLGMDPHDQYYRVLKTTHGLDGTVACEIIELTKNGKLLIGELNQSAIDGLKDLNKKNVIEVLQSFSKKKTEVLGNNNQRICDMIRNKKENKEQQRQTGHKRQDRGSMSDVRGAGLLPTLSGHAPASQPPVQYPPRLASQPPVQYPPPLLPMPMGPRMNSQFAYRFPPPQNPIPPANMQPPRFNQPFHGNLNIISYNRDPGKRKRRRDNNQDGFVSAYQTCRKVEENLDRLLELSNKAKHDSGKRESRDFDEPDKDQNTGRGQRRRRRGGRGRKKGGEEKEGEFSSDSESLHDFQKGSTDTLNQEKPPFLGNNFFSESNLSSHRGRGNERGRQRGRGGNERGRGGMRKEEYQGQIDHEGNRGRGRGRGRRGGKGRRNGDRNDGNNDDNVNQDVDGSDDESDSGSYDNRLSESLSNLHGGRGRQRGGRSRGRGARGGTADRQRKDTSSTISDNEEEDDDIDENEVFKFLVKKCKGLTAYGDFIKRCQLFPDGFDASEWFRRHQRRFRLIVKNQEIMYILPFYGDATICLDHNRLFSNKKGCRRKNCDHFHICKRFVAGHCRFRNRCRFSHDFGSKVNQEQKRRLGLDDVFTDEDLRIILRDRYPMICPDYFGVDSCDRGDACPYLHLCKKFVAGKCSKENCTYSHDMKTGHNMWILGKQGWAACVMKDKVDFVKKIILTGRPRKQTDDLEEENEDEEEEGGEDNDDVIGDEEDEETEVDVFKEMEALSQEPKPKVSRKDRFKPSQERQFERKESEESQENDMAALQDDFQKLKLKMEELEKRQGAVDSKGGAKPKVPQPNIKNEAVSEYPPSGTKSKFTMPGEAWAPHETTNIPKPPVTQNITPGQSWMKEDADKKPICLGYIGGTCNDCDKGHHPADTLPYLWQIKKDKWVCLPLQGNQEVEEEYCNKEQVIDTEVLVDDKAYAVHICHDEQRNLKAVVFACNGMMIEKSQSFPARRLSTESHGNKTASKAFYTQWRWYWKDDTGAWVPYDSDGFQKTLENKYVFGQTSYLFTRSNYQFKYRIDFRTFKQVNLYTRKEREIMRRPLFVSPSDVINKKYPETLSVQPIPVQPTDFAPWDITSDFELVELNPGRTEFKDVKSQFGRTMDADRFKVTFIYRVQNRNLLKEYKTKKQNMVDDIKQEGDKRDVAEMKLFHGTDNIDICRAICTNNFDFRTSGKNATMYGEGSYFAVDAKYSHSYTKQGPDGQRYIFRAKVLAGLSTNGHSSYRRPPLRPGQAHKLYDSCVDDENWPNIYVIFDRGQCYPEYLIAYREEYNYAPTEEMFMTASQQPSHTVQVPTAQPLYRNPYTTASFEERSGQANQPCTPERPYRTERPERPVIVARAGVAESRRSSQKDSCVVQ